MIKVKADWLYKTVLRGFAGTTIAPFIFYKTFSEKTSATWIKEFWNHENIHIKQQYELFVIGFFYLYLYYYIKNRLNGLNHMDAYRNSPFELEANKHQSNPNYIKTRKKYAWKTYIKNKK